MPTEFIPIPLETKGAAKNFSGQSRVVAAGQGAQWWNTAWQLFKAEPGTWVVIGLLFLLSALVQLIPLFNFLGMILMSCFAGGWMLACARQYEGNKPDINDLFAGFQKKFVPLVLLGLTTAALSIAAIVIAVLPFGGGLLSLFFTGPQNFNFSAAFGGFGLTLVLVVALMTPISMACWFAPVLIMQHDYSVMQALKASLKACAINWLPLSVYGLLFIMFSVIATLLLGLGWLVLIPLIFLSIYSAYRDIFYQM